MAHYIRPHGEGCLVRFGEVCARKSEAAKMELADPPASRTPGSISSSPNPNSWEGEVSPLPPRITLLWCDPYNHDALSITAIEAAVSCHHPNHLPADYYRPLKRLGLVGPSIFSRPRAPFSMRKIEWSTEI